MLTLPEICEYCRREVQALEWVIELLNYAEKRVAEVTFRESVEGVCCMDCVPEDWRRVIRSTLNRPIMSA